jgi:RND family efflux transporter MFP subunit
VFGTATESGIAQDLENAEESFDCVIEPRRIVELGSAEDGVVREMLVDSGEIVEAGADVARQDYELQTLAVELARVRAERDVEVRSSRARLEYRRREVARAKQLHDKSIVPTKQLDEANIERQLAQHGVIAAELDQRAAQVELQLAETRLERRTIRSTVTGVVTEVSKSVGELTHDQAPVMTIAEIDPLHVEVFVPIEQYGRIGEGLEAEVVPGAPVNGLYRARVEVVDRVLDAASGTFGVRLVLDNPDYRLPAGLKCQVRFLARKAEGGSPGPAADEAIAAPPPAEGDAVTAAAPAATTGDLPQPETAASNPAWDNRALIYVIQTKLLDAGYDPGPPDGVLGERTRAAIEAYQDKNGLPVDGTPSLELFNALRHEEQAPR